MIACCCEHSARRPCARTARRPSQPSGLGCLPTALRDRGACRFFLILLAPASHVAVFTRCRVRLTNAWWRERNARSLGDTQTSASNHDYNQSWVAKPSSRPDLLCAQRRHLRECSGIIACECSSRGMWGCYDSGCMESWMARRKCSS